MPLALGAPAPEFRVESTAGPLNLAGLRGRPFVLCFFSMAFTPT